MSVFETWVADFCTKVPRLFRTRFGLWPGADTGRSHRGVSLASLVGRRLKSGLKRARLMLYRFPHEGVTWILPFQPRSYIHSQDPKTAHSIDESIPLFLRPTVVL